MKLTITSFTEAMPRAKSRIPRYIETFNQYNDELGINTPMRIAHFLAQIGHESLDLYYKKELASGKAYDTGTLAKRLGNTPEADGDGQKYKGRGFIQITGHDNYKDMGKRLGEDLLKHPELLETDKYAMLSAMVWWSSRGCNDMADNDELTKITKKINGGMNGFADRLHRLGVAKKALRKYAK